MSTLLEVDVLGPLEVRVDGELIALSRQQLRQVVTLLATSAGRPTPAERLIAGLWPVDLPQNPDRALRVVLSRLRTALGPAAEALRADDLGLTLHADTDLDRFLELADLHDGDRGDTIERALKLWRGRPLQDLDDLASGEQLAASLHETRIMLGHELASARVRSGRPTLAIEALGPLVAEAPHRADLVALLARAYALDGQKSEALRVIAAARTRATPNPTLDTAEHEVLTGAIELDATDRPRAPTDLAGFVGRDTELDILRSPTTAATVIVGEPGIGKSTLLDRALPDLENEAVVIRVGVPANPERPLEPIARVLEALVETDPLLTAEPRFDAVYAQIVPGHQAAAADAASLTREELLSAATDVIATAASGNELLIAFDDCHLLDRSSAAVLQHLVDTRACRVVATSRHTAAPHLDFLLGGEHPDITMVALPPLSVDDVGVYVASKLSARSVPIAAELHARTGGNPLFLQLLTDLLETDHVDASALPSSVLVAVQARLSTLSQRTIDTLQHASALGSPFSLAILRELRIDADTDVQLAADEGLVRIHSDGDAAAFRHSVVAEATYQLIPEAQRIALHAEIGQLLQDVGATPAEYSHHFGQAASFDPIRAVRAHLDAADSFATAFAWDVVDRHLTAARECHEALVPHAVHLDAELTVKQGICERALSRTDSHRLLLRGARLAREVDDRALFVAAVLELCDNGPLSELGYVNDQVASLLDEALAVDIAEPLRAELLATASSVLLPLGEAERARGLYAEAERIVDDISDTAVEARVLVKAHQGLAHPDDFERRGPAAARLHEIAGVNPELRWEAALMSFGIAATIGDRTQLDTALDALRGITPHLPHRHYRFGHAYCEATYSLLLGELDRAEAQLGPVLDHGLGLYGETRVMTIYGALLLAIRQRQGRSPDVWPLLTRLIENRPGFATWSAVGAHLCAEIGDDDGVAHHLDQVRGDDFAALVKDLTFTAAVALLVKPISIAGTTAEIDSLYRQLEPHTNRMTWTGNASFGPVDDSLGELARLLGRAEQASEHDRRSRTILTRLGAAQTWR